MAFAIVQFIAVLNCTISAGTVIYINLIWHPARMGFGTRVATIVWAPNYYLATTTQSPLAIVSCLAGYSMDSRR